LSLLWSKRLIFALAAALPAALLDAVLPTPANPQAPVSLAGQLLIASPAMSDPRFQQTVVLMVRHDQSGAFGIVINRPVGERPLAKFLEAIGEKGSDATGNVRIFVGGPVQPELGFVVHSADYQRAETLAIDGRLAMTSSLELFRDVAAKKGPAKFLFAFGYAGWGPGQLEGELALNAWYMAPADPKLVFDEDRDKVWDSAMARRTRDL
jgi:putative transcriptional regulator